MATFRPDFNHVATYRAGDMHYSDQHKRGTVDVWHDQHRYIYIVNRKHHSIKEVKNGILAAFASNSDMKIIGKYPSYELQSF